jgi:SAM-dependent methyltransferase
MRGLEIGPSYRPLFPKSDGWGVTVVDHADRRELVAKYQAWEVDTSAIEDVDVVLRGRGIESLEPKKAFDYIVASHVIEHVPNPVGFLNSAFTLLKPGGTLRLAVPDKRYCFDILKPVTTTGQFLQAHLENRTQHTFGQIVDALMLHAMKGSDILFPTLKAGDRLAFAHSAAQSYQMAQRAISGGYLDIHAWVFTPTSFEMICRQLKTIGLFPFVLVSLVPDERHEFLVDLIADDTQATQQPVTPDLLVQVICEQAAAVNVLSHTYRAHSETPAS